MDKDKFLTILSDLDVKLSEQQIFQLDEYYKTLVEWNEFMNLTAITEYDEVLVKHFADSLAVKKIFDELFSSDSAEKLAGKTIIDVGTGAGFPGMVLKIGFPELHVTLLDSLNKRVKFLDEVVRRLDLKDIETIHARAEEGAAKQELRQQFDIGVSRAVANLSTLCEYVMPYIKRGGFFIAYKSGDIDEEVKNASKAVEILGGELYKVHKFTIPHTDIERSFVIVKKVKDTPKKYPRKAGLPGKEPLHN